MDHLDVWPFHSGLRRKEEAMTTLITSHRVHPLLVHVPRVVLGAMFLISGLEGMYTVFTGRTILAWPETLAVTAFTDALKASLFFWPWLKGLELIAGVLLVANRYVPFALALLVPIAATIILMHLTINLPGGVGFALFLMVLGGWLLYVYRAAFAGLLVKNMEV